MTAVLHEGPPFAYGRTLKDHSSYINKIKYNKDGAQFVSVSSDKKIHVYEGKDGVLIKTLASQEGHTGSIYSFAYVTCTRRTHTCTHTNTHTHTHTHMHAHAHAYRSLFPCSHVRFLTYSNPCSAGTRRAPRC